MARQIRVSPDALRSAAEKYNALKNMVSDDAESLTVLINQLENVWEGGAAIQAKEYMLGICNASRKGTEGLQYFGNKLNRVAQMFENIDMENGITDLIETLDIRDLPASIVLKCPPLRFFMPGQIRIVPDEVRQIADNCSRVANDILEVVNQGENVLDELRNDWEGNSHDRFEADANNMLNAFVGLSETIRELANDMRKAADRYEELDNRL